MTLATKYPDKFQHFKADQLGTLFREAWNHTSVSFTKVEVAPVFTEDGDKSFELFAENKLKDAAKLVAHRVLRQGEMFEQLISKGGRITRLRVVGRPATPYIRDYERHAYAATSEIGEQTFIVDESSIRAELIDQVSDFLLFDDQELLVHSYSPWGRLVGVSRTTDQNIVSIATAVVNELNQHAIPSSDYGW